MRLTEALELPKLRGRVEVGDDLRVTGFENVFAIGDMAAARGRCFPTVAAAGPAGDPGGTLRRRANIRLLAGEETTSFSYRDKGIMAAIGRRAAVAQLPSGIRLRGTPAWLAWLGLHIVFLLGVRNKTSVILNWAWRYVFWRRGPKVIAGG